MPKNEPLYDLTINLYDLTTINVTLYVYVIILVKIVVSLHRILKVTRKINNETISFSLRTLRKHLNGASHSL